MENLPSLLKQLRSLTRDPAALESLSAEYKTIRSKTLALKAEMGLTTEVGAQTHNVKKNRYKDILPYDQNRVVLRTDHQNDSDYINASFIKGVPGRQYIASQGPLPNTVEDFWKMVWTYKVKVIIMAAREIEMGKKKCECYWPAVNQSNTFGCFSIYNQGEVSPNEDIVQRNLTVTHQQETRSVHQYQYISWPDHDVPDSVSGVLDLLDLLGQVKQTQHAAPIVVHCSAGCGRTGVICILDYIRDLLVAKQIQADFSIGDILTEVRLQRPAAVQTKEQYHFIFSAVTVMFEKAMRPPVRRLHSNHTQFQNSNSFDTSSRPAIVSQRSLPPPNMNDTYAVVSKPPKSHPPTSSPAHSPSATPTSSVRSRGTPPSHHPPTVVIYDNDLPAAPAATPLYSVVKPRPKPTPSGLSPNPIYDVAGPANPRLGEGSETLGSGNEYEQFTALQKHPAPGDDDDDDDDDYEDISNLVKTPGPMGFNCRIKKPRGPRDPPAEWSR